MKLKIFSALALLCGLMAYGQNLPSPYSNVVFPSQTFTATGQTGTTIQLNGLVVPSTVGSSFASGNITLTGASLTTATFALQGSADNGKTYFPLALGAISTPGTTATTVTATGPGLYQVSLAGLTHVRFTTSGTFTATNIGLTLTASPNGLPTVLSGGGGGGGGGTPGGNNGDIQINNNGSFGGATAAQIVTAIGATPVANSTNATTATTATDAAMADSANGLVGAAISGTPAAHLVPVGVDGTHIILRQLTGDDIAAGFTINTFAGCSSVEIGATITNPAFTASYSSTPTSATITNTAGIGSPLTLTTPFTSGTVTGAFTESTASTVTFTLNAVGAVTQSKTCASQWINRVFAGVGTAGATSSVTATGTTAVLSNGAVLSGTTGGGGLSNSQVGVTFGPFAPSGQKIYLLIVGTGHTSFIDASTGFAFPMNAPTSVSLVNVNGATVPLGLYESTNPVTSSAFSVKVNN